MTNKKFVFSASVVLAMTLMAGCSSHKANDSANQNAGTDSSSGMNNSSGYDSSANGNGSDYASQAERTVYFGFDQSTLSSEGQSIVDNNIAKLKNGSQHIRLEGHADERGTREYNLALGERRANAVLQYMVANGIAKSRIETISYGKERPADAGHDESAWSKNRRVEIVLN